jgi:hypothetical protein
MSKPHQNFNLNYDSSELVKQVWKHGCQYIKQDLGTSSKTRNIKREGKIKWFFLLQDSLENLTILD